MTEQQHQALKATAQIKALLAEHVAQAQRGEVVDGSVTQIAEPAIQASNN